MADSKDCNCLTCRAEARWGNDPKAAALTKKISEIAISGSEVLLSKEEPMSGDPITLLAWIGTYLLTQADQVDKIMTAFDALPEEEQDQMVEDLGLDLDSFDEDYE